MTATIDLKPLDAFSRWMVKRNIERVAEDGLAFVLANLRDQGYTRVAAAVEADSMKPKKA